MTSKPCRVCHSMNRGPSGKCNDCAARRMRERRGKPPEIPGAVSPTSAPIPANVSIDFFLEKHQNALNNYQTMRTRLEDQRNQAAEPREIQFYDSELRKLLQQETTYILNMSKELAIWRQLQTKDTDFTPVHLFVNVITATPTPPDAAPIA